MSNHSPFPSDDSATESNNGMSHYDSAGGDTPEPVEYVAPDVANREEKAVTRSKILVLLVLLLAVSGAATATYLLMESQEKNDFEAALTNHNGCALADDIETQFAGLGSEVSTVAGQKVDQIYSALEAFSTFISSEAHADSNSRWPFVLVRDFALKSERMSELVGLKKPGIVFLPIVQEEDREGWGSLILESAPVYYQESVTHLGDSRTVEELMNITVPFLYEHGRDENGVFTGPIEIQRSGPILPFWQTYPLPDPIEGLLPTSFDMSQFPEIASQLTTTNVTLQPSTTFVQFFDPANPGSVMVASQIMQPVVENGNLVAVIIMIMPWHEYFQNLHVDGLTDTIAIIRSSCNIGIAASGKKNELSYLINSTSATFLGQLDSHDPKYDDLVVSRVILDVDVDDSKLPEGICVPTLTLDLYPTEELEVSFQTSKPKLYTVVVVSIFFFTSLVFVLYDYFVGRRQRKFMARIKRQDQIVSNVFPAAIRDRLYKDEQKGSKHDDLLDPLGAGAAGAGGAPLADLFLETTVVFADIAGFTAWSSAREPAQVFVLLETIYGAFDKHAYRHNVFKVETVGDCYVAVAGLPEPDKDHAMSVCRFARDCVKTMKDTTLKLEVSLGPDTSELELRVGVHSGQVTAGVLRGERSRFQLFGDTMNTAARMESTSARNHIQVSQVTADLLVASGLSGWIAPRKCKIFVKGKGEMQTYWLKTKAVKGLKPSKSKGDMPTLAETIEMSDSSDRSGVVHENDNFDLDNVETMTKTERLVEWNVEVLSPLLQQIVASREADAVPIDPSLSQKEATIGKGKTVLEEFVPIIPLKRFDAAELSKRSSTTSIDIGEEAKTQLRNYLSNVASMYRHNPFHNFEHASHVTASVKKLLTRIVKVDDGNGLRASSDKINLIDMAGHSYGITSDPLTQFSVVFSAIIHDLDHPGVPNGQLVKENTRNAQIFKKSIAEQNSVELAWAMLMGKEYEALRACIYHTEDDLRRFRQLVVNTVMATDIVDKELQALRKARWETAFAETPVQDTSLSSNDRKATIVIEHLIQASDVSHTMQHWHIYKSWNEKFFLECYAAYKAGRAGSDPSQNWYKGEIGFFDFYVIPLAKKLDDCGVFGVSSHEYLNYAQSNRDEWAREGERLVKEYLVKYEEITTE
eukprot:scaffold735_cov116-Cylindrotheca_fusiformis.AAC.25